MEKVKEIIVNSTEKLMKHDNILMFIILMAVTSKYLWIKLDANDSLWTFSNIYKMYNGFKIYQDINIIQTPLYFYIGNIMFYIFKANYLTYMIYDYILIQTLTFFIVFMLLKKMKVEKYFAFITTVVLLKFSNGIATYNQLAIMFVLIGIIVEISQNKYKNIFQGIIIFLVFFSKQNLGVYYMIAIIVYNIIKIDTKKNKIIALVQMFSIAGILFLTYVTYLYKTNSLVYAINYLLGGLNEFALKNKVISYLIIAIIAEVTIAIAFIIVTYKKEVPLKDSQKNNIRLIGLISVVIELISFPLINEAHVRLGSLIFAILFIYFIYITLEDFILKDNVKTLKLIFVLIIFIYSIIYSSFSNILYIKNITNKEYSFDKNSVYFGAIATDDTVKEINEVCKYIKDENAKGINVKVISCYANLYMNIFKVNNGEMDMPFYGNLGKDGEDGLINQINELKNTEILILNDNQENKKYQESDKVNSYIKENLKYCSEINRFLVYYKE